MTGRTRGWAILLAPELRSARASAAEEKRARAMSRVHQAARHAALGKIISWMVRPLCLAGR
eukprot:CAMPEP_0119056570 /NCGR_PEP_ID=MMETSP1178-20130426/1207_1 /TAXON_ID=33656 /ORGANISM="unid sp, Strain CCMP2000" /LENGTH=60 /DNA_ID=CAMNT_0007037311 /DNA_START=511 /DNA_END=693 /DNA_ORIENTATION=+